MARSNVENPREITEDIIGKSLQFIPPEVDKIVGSNEPVALKLEKLLILFDLINRLRAALIAPISASQEQAYSGNKPNR